MRRMLLPFLCLGLLFSLHASAQSPELIPASGELTSACNFKTGVFSFDCVPMYIGYLTKILFGMSGGFALVEILKAGYQIALSGLPGQDKEAGKRRLTWAILGLTFSILAFVIVDFVISSLILGP